MFKRFLTSSIGLSLIAAFIIIGGGVALKMSQTKPENNIRTKINAISEESIKRAIESGQVDTTDWESALKIVNGTSTLDEKIASLQESSATSNIDDEPLTATDRFTRVLLEKYVKYKNSGGVIDENTSINFVNELITKDYGGPAGEKVYTESDITVLDTSSATEIKRYANYLGLALTLPTSRTYENEIILINKVYETEDAQYLDKLPENIARYVKMREQISAIAVPSVLKAAHIALLNSLSALIEGVRGMALIDSDPVGATKLMLRYEDGLKSLDASIAVITNYLKNQQINFSSTESGYLFYR